MFTARLLGESKNKQSQRHIVTVEFTDGEQVFQKDFSFSLGTTIEVMKKTVKVYLDEINLVIPEIPTDVDFTDDSADPTPAEPTADELARIEWEADFAKLEKVKRLIDTGVLTGNEAQIVTLRNKVKADFKPAYLG